jgi:ABC-2 type transport system permease protein
MLRDVIVVEVWKLRRAKVTWMSWLVASLMPLAGALFLWMARDPERAARWGLLGSKARVLQLEPSWSGFFGLLVQMTGLGGMLLVSVIAAWIFGREYADGTAKNMLTLPVARLHHILAKLVVVLSWFGLLVTALLVEGLALATWLQLPGWSSEVVLRGVSEVYLSALVVFTLVPSVAWLAIAGRGYFAALGFTILMLVVGNVLGATGWGRWFPWSIVPLFAGVAGPRHETLSTGSFAVIALTFAGFLAATIRRLYRADEV